MCLIKSFNKLSFELHLDLIKSFKIFALLVFFFSFCPVFATDYYFHPQKGNDQNDGLSKVTAFKTFSVLSQLKLKPGDRIILAHGQVYYSGIRLYEQNGSGNSPIVITSIPWKEIDNTPALIDFKGQEYGILIENSSHIVVSELSITSDGYTKKHSEIAMRSGVLIKSSQGAKMSHITLEKLKIFNVYYENKGYRRAQKEVKTANGTEKYGWGIRVITADTNSVISNIKIVDNQVFDVGHTGIKFTGLHTNIINSKVTGNEIQKTGGPGIQMSHVKDFYIGNNLISHSGDNSDTRKWGRGSGLWTWSSENVLIEKNKFLYANGPGDSAGAHIDFNCKNIIIQHNISAYNAGGFCEILGNNYNCIYRYNISINDGYRVKGQNGAFQEGKIIWLSGYQGEKKPRKGPVNSYIYNNTIYTDSSLVAKIAIDNTSKGLLIANNIFFIKGKTISVLGDQYNPDSANNRMVQQVVFKNNLFLNKNNWPTDLMIQDESPIFGNPHFAEAGSLNTLGYVPYNQTLIKHKGIYIKPLPGDNFFKEADLKVLNDISGRTISSPTSIGALVPLDTDKAVNSENGND